MDNYSHAKSKVQVGTAQVQMRKVHCVQFACDVQTTTIAVLCGGSLRQGIGPKLLRLWHYRGYIFANIYQITTISRIVLALVNVENRRPLCFNDPTILVDMNDHLPVLVIEADD